MLWQPGMRMSAERLQRSSPTDIATYVPTVAGGGSATFNIQTGYYSRTDQWIDVVLYLSVSVAGSGSSNVTVDMPSAVDRSIRQALLIHGETVGAGGGSGIIRGGECVFFTSGSGATSDRLRVDANAADGEANITGADLKSGALITITGRYREA